MNRLFVGVLAVTAALIAVPAQAVSCSYDPMGPFVLDEGCFVSPDPTGDCNSCVGQAWTAYENCTQCCNFVHCQGPTCDEGYVGCLTSCNQQTIVWAHCACFAPGKACCVEDPTSCEESCIASPN